VDRVRREREAPADDEQEGGTGDDPDARGSGASDRRFDLLVEFDLVRLQWLVRVGHLDLRCDAAMVTRNGPSRPVARLWRSILQAF
jgi:hypothetical protein